MTAEAVQRALSLVGQGVYRLGAGDWRPHAPDAPWRSDEACDCVGLVAWAYRWRRKRPGYNRGAWSSVVDWLNTDSMIEQAEHDHPDRLVEIATTPAVGDLIAWPSIRAHGKRARIGHIGIIVAVPSVWRQRYGELDVVQCQSRRRPAVQRTTGSAWTRRDRYRGLIDEAWRTRVLRVV